MFNEVTLVGRLGKDPDHKKIGNDQSVCSLWMATSDYTQKDGQRVERTEWHSVTVWGNQADACNNYLNKGSLVFVKGRIQSREYDGNDGVKRKAYEIIANTVKFLSPKNNSTAPQQEEKPVDVNSVPW